MPFTTLRQAQIYYETFGSVSTRPPIVLIHGSTINGQVDWRLVAPLLAEDYYVIVPDCRGHGRSTNPDASYSFAGMAADIAALVRQLGFETAHIIGHSNGGNVALVTLLEHPKIVESAVLQAANAYVSQDLIEKEPAIFDPERVQREAPSWMDEMIALHGPTHGADYWRTLLQLTLQEIITEPNYTPQQLARVQSPTLVIQGEQDRVNAPARHAQFIAEHIPQAELWIPEGGGHNVHVEQLFDWVERVRDFLYRRGDPANDKLYRLRKQSYPDRRQTWFNLHAHYHPGRIDLAGSVLTAEQLLNAMNTLDGMSAAVNASDVKVLLPTAARWALVKWNTADLRREPDSNAERDSQVLLGEAVNILEEQGEWLHVRVQHDGYLGWMLAAALHPCSQENANQYRASCQAVVIADLLPATDAEIPLGSLSTPILGRIPFGVALPVAEWDQEFASIYLPDNRVWRVASSGLLPIERRPKPDAEGIQFTLNLLRGMMGVPYLWGGRTPFGYDCSGLAQTFLRFMGLTPPRDADQQYQAGKPVSSIPQPGDLQFFGRINPNAPTGRYANVTHVAISLGGTEVLHSSSSVGGVQINSLDPSSPRFLPVLRERHLGARRLI